MKIITKLLLTSVLSALVFYCTAQNHLQDVVYLKNGGIMRGSIIEFIPEKYVKIETIGGNTFVYQVGEIEKCVKEAERKADPIYNSTPEIHPETTPAKDTAGLRKGYYGVFEMGSGISGGYMEGPLRTKINIINGYRVNPWFALGMGLGFRSYPGYELFMPMFVDLRTNFLNKRTSPYFSLGLGYALNLTDVNRGGPMLTPTFGVSVKMKKRMAINLGLNYELQRSKSYYYLYDYYYPQYYMPTPTNEFTHTFSFQFGLSF